ncbi:MAG: glycosyltransferase family 4 protein [Bacteroidales bacterium]|nr:glycosyltransferase family 4 protein [Bacteroidales bacterium]
MKQDSFTLCILGDGQSIFVQHICNFFVQKNVKVHLITFRNAYIPHVTIHHLLSKKINPQGNNFHLLLHTFKIRKLIRSIKPDILYALYATSYGFMAAFSGVSPLFLHAIGSDVLISPRKNFLYRLILKFVFNRSTRIYAVSEQIIEKIQKMGISSSRIQHAILGVQSDIFRPFFNEKIPFSIISTRNFEKIYRIEALIPAIALLRQHYPLLQVFLAGKGSQEVIIRNLVKNYQLDDVVTFLGYLSPEKLASYLQKTMIYVSLSSSDGASISLLEAMSCSCIPVVTNIPANTYWIQDGKNGFLLHSLEPTSIASTIEKVFSLSLKEMNDMQQINYQLVAEKGDFKKIMDKIYLSFLSHLKQTP